MCITTDNIFFFGQVLVFLKRQFLPVKKTIRNPSNFSIKIKPFFIVSSLNSQSLNTSSIKHKYTWNKQKAHKNQNFSSPLVPQTPNISNASLIHIHQNLCRSLCFAFLHMEMGIPETCIVFFFFLSQYSFVLQVGSHTSTSYKKMQKNQQNWQHMIWYSNAFN